MIDPSKTGSLMTEARQSTLYNDSQLELFLSIQEPLLKVKGLKSAVAARLQCFDMRRLL